MFLQNILLNNLMLIKNILALRISFFIIVGNRSVTREVGFVWAFQYITKFEN